MALDSKAFATFLILCPTSFFLGIIFASFPYDYPLLWTRVPTPDSFFDLVEDHLKLIHASPPLVSRILHIVIGIGLLGFFMKLFKATESNWLFDGASLVLYMVGVIIYITNIVKGLRTVTAGTYGTPGGLGAELSAEQIATGTDPGDMELLTREDSLRVVSATNTIMALVLVGVLVLQAGQWYAERKEQQEIDQFEQDAKEAEAKAKNGNHSHNHTHGHGHKSPSGKEKKKQ